MNMTRMDITGKKKTVSHCNFYSSRTRVGGVLCIAEWREEIDNLPFDDDSYAYIMLHVTKLASSK